MKKNKGILRQSLSIILALALILSMTPAALSTAVVGVSQDNSDFDFYSNDKSGFDAASFEGGWSNRSGSGGGGSRLGNGGFGRGYSGGAADGGDAYVPDEVLASANSLKHAQEIAEAYGLELKSYAWGIAVLAAPAPEDSVVRSMIMRRVDMPRLSLNRIYHTLEYDGYQYEFSAPIESPAPDPPAPPDRPTPDPILLSDPEVPPLPVQWYHDEINTFGAWSKSTGKDVVIAVVDTGIDIDHPAFDGRISDLSYNSHINQVGVQHVKDIHGHGTFVSGIAVSNYDNPYVFGIAQEAQIMVINAFDPYNYEFQMSSMLRGINYASENGADIINLSLGRPYSDGVDDLEQQVIANAVANGVTIICAAGNNRAPNAFYPAAYPETIAVSATTYGSWFESEYSNYGPEIDVAAPGSFIQSTFLYSTYHTASGTSYSASVVSSIAALVKSLHPEYSQEQMRALLRSTARDAGDLGRDDYYGHGIVNAYAAVLGLDALYKVTFDFNDGERESVTARVVPGSTLLETNSPLRDGYAFNGWYLSDGSGLFDFANPVNSDLELTARWIKAGGDMYLTAFPDVNFRRAVLQTLYDLDFVRRTESDLVANDKHLLDSITYLDVAFNGIRDMTGLEYFTMLQGLDCWGNELTELDISANINLESLNCSENQLTELNTANNPALRDLNCGINSIDALDLSGNADLEILYCRINQLATLDVSNNTRLKTLICWNNQLTELDVSNNSNLKVLECDDNQLTELDLLNNTLLEYLYCGENKLTELDLSNNALLESLICKDTLISELDVSNNTALMYLWLSNNQLISLDVTNNPHLIELVCESNKLTSLDVSNNPELVWLFCQNNFISNLDTSNNTELIELVCSVNYLTGLDVSKNTNLVWLDCILNNMESINDVLGWQDNPELILDKSFHFYPQASGDLPVGEDITDSFKDAGFLAAVRDIIGKSEGPILDYDVAKITSLYLDSWNIEHTISDLSGLEHFRALVSLSCAWQQLEKVDLSQNTALLDLQLSGNQLTELDVSKNTALMELYCEYNSLTELDLSNNTALKILYCSSNELAALDLKNNTALVLLDCNYNELTELDVSNHTALEMLNCSGNQLTELDVSQNIELNVLYCSENQLAKLDVANNTALVSLDCSGNLLTELDVSQNKELMALFCSWNELTGLDVSENKNLDTFDCSWNLLTGLDVSNITKMNWLNCQSNYMASPDDVKGWEEQGLVINSPENQYSANFLFYDQRVDGPEITFAEAFPDSNFRAVVLRLLNRTGGNRVGESVITAIDREILAAEVGLDVFNRNISDMTGLEYFTGLKRFYCDYNQLKTLDVSGNVDLNTLVCSYNQLTKLDVSNNAALTWLDCAGNYMSSPDYVSGWQDLGLIINSSASLYSGNFWFYNQREGVTFAEAFPDMNFRAFVLRELNGDGGNRTDESFISERDKVSLARQTDLDISYNNIADLTGIEYFVGLETLHCYGNLLTELDLSQNTALKWLSCTYNQLTKLNVSNNIALTQLNCDENQLTELDLSQNTKLETLTCQANRFIKLDLSNNKALKTLICRYNLLETLDVTKNSVLEALFCEGNLLTELDVSQNTALNSLFCADNKLTSLDVTQNTELRLLYCMGNYMTSPDDVKGWQELGLAINSPKDLFRGNFWFYNQHGVTPEITFADAFPDKNFRAIVLRELNWNDGGNRIDESYITENDEVSLARYADLDVSDKNIADLTGIEYFTGLEYLFCNNNSLTELDLSQNTELFILNCYSNQLTKLNISNNKALVVLSCYNNQLETLDVSENTALIYFNCSSNRLTKLDVSNNIALTTLYCKGNLLETLDVSENTALKYFWCDYNRLTELDVTKNSVLEELYCNNNLFETLDVSQNTALNSLACNDNKLSMLDVSHNTALKVLYCYNNSLEELDVSKNVALAELWCGYNLLTALDVTTNSVLEVLHCGRNKLDALDVSQNTALNMIWCFDNRLTVLDVTQNTALRELYCNDNYIVSPEYVFGWQEIGLDINSPDDLNRGSFRFYNQLQLEPPKPVITITTQPQDMLFAFEYGDSEARVEGSLTIEAEITPSGVPQFFWYLIQGDAPDTSVDTLVGVGAEYTLPVDLGFDAIGGIYQYYCVVFADVPFGEDFVISDVATVSVVFYIIDPILIITVQPALETKVTEGNIMESLLIEAVPAFISGPITYQWYSSADGSVDDITLIPGETGETFFIPADLTAENSPYYFVCAVYADGVGPVMSRVAAVFVAPKQDIPSTIPFDMVIRDFKADGILFEAGNGSLNKGLAEALLGADKKPIFIHERWKISWPAVTQFMLDSLFNNAEGYNMATVKTLTMIGEDDGFYVLNRRAGNGSFFPIDNELFGNEGRSHNCHFSAEYHGSFTYQGFEEIEVGADDDLWVFIDNRLVIDLGGLHVYTSERVSLPDLVAKGILEIEIGDTVDFALFYMERQSTGAELYIRTNMILTSEPSAGITFVDAFPDKAFRAHVLQLLNQDGNIRTDGSIVTDSDKEFLARLTVLVVYGSSIADLTGIEYFTGLEYLYCFDNRLTELDLSRNTALIELLCWNNQLTELDVTQNTELKHLFCYDNQLAELDVTQNKALTHLACGSNQLTELDVTQNVRLLSLDCGMNKLTELDLTQNIVLTDLSCWMNELTKLDLTQSTGLQQLICSDNQLTELDLSQNTALIYIWGNDNQLKELDLTNNVALEILYCSGNNLTELDVSQNIALGYLYCHDNRLTALDVTNNAALRYLYCFDNYMNSPDDVKGWQELGLIINSPDNLFSGSFLFYNQHQPLKPIITITAQPQDMLFAFEYGDSEARIDGSLTIEAEIYPSGTPQCFWYLIQGDAPDPSVDTLVGVGAEYTLPVDLGFDTIGGIFQYYCVVFADDPFGEDFVISDVATVSVAFYIIDPILIITVQPALETKVTEGNITESLLIEAVPAFAPPPITYQWYSSADGSVDDITLIPGETGETFFIPADLTAENSPYYFVCAVYADGLGPVMSNVATVFVAPKQDMPTTIPFDMVIRDFNADGILFETGGGYLTKGLAETLLGADKKPVFIYELWQNSWPTVTQSMLDSLFNDAEDYNMTTVKTLTMVSEDDGFYILNHRAGNVSFFPIDNELFGNEGRDHNYHFSAEYHGSFTYQGFEELEVGSDDDLWVFIDNKLVIDLGGMHGYTSENVSLPDLVAKGVLEIEVGDTVDFALFYMERQTFGAELYIRTNMILTSEPAARITFTDAFPDKNFRAYVLQQLNWYGSIRTDESIVTDSDKAFFASQTILDINNLRIADLTGIEYFTGLEYLYCCANLLTELDLSQNAALIDLQCWDNQLTKLDVSQNVELKQLHCGTNRLTELDVSQNTALISLICWVNELTKLDLTQNIDLQLLECSYNLLTELDLSQNPALDYLHCHDNKLTALDVTHNTALSDLYCYDNYMNSPDDVKGWQELGLTINSPEDLYSGNFRFYNQHQSPKPVITITAQPQNLMLSVEHGTDVVGSLSIEAEVAPAGTLQYAWYLLLGDEPDPAKDRQIGEDAEYILPVDLGYATGERRFIYYCVVSAENAASVISDLATVFIAFYTVDPVLSITVQPAAETTVMEGNITESLYIEAIPQEAPPPITYQWYSSIDGYYNEEALILIPGATNQLFPIPADLTSEGSPYYFYCGVYAGGIGPVMSDVAKVIVEKPVEKDLTFAQAFPDPNFLQAVLEMPEWDGNKSGDDIITESDLEVLAARDVVEITERGIVDLTGLEYFATATELKAGGNLLTELDLSKNPAITVLHCWGNELSELDLSHTSDLVALICDYNELTSLDLSHTPGLRELSCNVNLLTELNLSQVPALESLYVSHNNLTALDLSQNLKLTTLHCYDNQLTSLDVSANTALTWLVCGNNLLTELNVWNNTALTDLSCTDNELVTLDLSNNPELENLHISNNLLTGLDVSNNLKLLTLYCPGNYMTSPESVIGWSELGLVINSPEYLSDGTFLYYDQLVPQIGTVVLKSIKITAYPEKTIYAEGEALDLTGLVVTAVYSDGSENDVTGYSTEPEEYTILHDPGVQTVTISYTEDDVTVTASFDVAVGEDVTLPVLERIIISSEPEKTVYTQGEALDLTGLTVTAIYDDGSEKEVTGYSTEPGEGTELDKVGMLNVMVTYFENDVTVIAEFTVVVIEKPAPENKINIHGVELEFGVENGVAILTPTEAQMMDIIMNSGNNVVIDFRDYDAVDIYVAAEWFKDINKTLTIVTLKGSGIIRTQNLWNNSGKMRLISVRDGRISVNNV